MQVFKQLSHGVYVISVRAGEACHAFTAAWVMQVSFSPPLLAFSINPHHYSYQLLKIGGLCTVNVLSNDQFAIAQHFGQSGINNKMAAYSWHGDVDYAPILTDALAYFQCTVSHTSSAGDHELFVCVVQSAEILRSGEPLLYSDTANMDKSSHLYTSNPR